LGAGAGVCQSPQGGAAVQEHSIRSPHPQAVGSLVGTTVLVTGASRGIGRAIALAAARAGADVAVTYRGNETDARAVAREIECLERNAYVYQTDISVPDSVTALAARARADLGTIDVWVNNAGADILTGSAAKLSALEKLDVLIAVDLRGSIYASWTAAQLMLEQPRGGVIINVSWDHAVSGMKGKNPELFAAVKGGVLSFSKSLARSVAPKVRVNVLAPGWIETAFGAELDEAKYQRVVESTPLQRWGTPDDVAGAAVFLASSSAAFLTGHTLFVNGGVVM
jgi:3-oxoacyl-[acyl-carrier protein] reductase